MELEKQLDVTNVPAKLAINFDTLKLAMQKKMEPYTGVVVTADTLASSKKLATEINTTCTVLDTVRKDEIKKASVEIVVFDKQMKELIGIGKESRAKLLNQVKVFDDELVEQLNTHLDQLAENLWDAKSVAEEFRNVQYADLLLISNANAKDGKPVKKARDAIEARVNANKDLQNQTENRLLRLENECLKAGLVTPLERTHIEAFIFADESEYQERLAKLFAVELDRHERAKIIEQKKKDDDAVRIAKVAEPEVVQVSTPVVVTRTARQDPTTQHYNIVASFTIETPLDFTEQEVIAEFQRLFAQVDLADSLTNIAVGK